MGACRKDRARALGLSRDAMLAHDRAWVLMRLRMQVDRYPAWRDLVRVETWPSGIDGLFATREFILYDADDATLARGTSAWGVIDVKRRRPMRVPEDLHTITPPDRARPLSFESWRVPALERADHARRFDVRFSDLDLNRHVNNVRYVEWALEAVPEAVLTVQHPVDLDIAFRAEITFGATVVAQAQRLATADGSAFLHAVRRAEDDQIAARAHTRWRAPPYRPLHSLHRRAAGQRPARNVSRHIRLRAPATPGSCNTPGAHSIGGPRIV